LLYNKAELKKAIGTTSPPATMADFETDAKAVVQKIQGTYGFETDGQAYSVLPFLYAFGGGMFDPQENPVVANDGSVNGLTFLSRLQNTDKVMPTNVNFSLGDIPQPVTDFMVGRTAMIFGGPYDVSQILTGPSFGGDYGNLGVARIPTCPPGYKTCRPGQTTGSPLTGQSYVISASTTHPKEAEEFISFMSSKDRQIKIAEKNATLPTRHSAYTNEVLSEPFISDFYNLEKQQRLIPLPAISQAAHLFDALNPAIAKVLDDNASPKSALEDVADAWKQLLAGP
jgi:arabinogalactan oligomer / maltooligosaccharide transport system substrate-binding protein